MDPTATLNALHQAIACCAREDAHDLVDTLLDWIDRGGFVPAGLLDTNVTL